MMHFTYLLVDFLTVIIPLFFSFHPKLNFYKTWRSFFPAVIITGLYFLLWDAWFTSLGVWGFNAQYLTGIMIGSLPLEEVLFFLCIPYACVFTFHCLTILLKPEIGKKAESAITILLISILLLIGIFNYQKAYTATTFWSLAALLIVAKYWLKVEWLGRFYIIYAILLLPFLIVNGILTGAGLDNPVVWYNDKEILGIRILTIPFEDIFYGMELILINLLIYRHLLTRHAGIKDRILNHEKDIVNS